jgi:hypothetical protein
LTHAVRSGLGEGNEANSQEGKRWVLDAAAAAGDPWKRCERVEMVLSGEWRRIVEKLQPGLVDSGYRKRSVEVYEPRLNRVTQTHTGPMGSKRVLRSGRDLELRFDGVLATDPEKRASAALVADAYGLFGFGASWLADKGTDFELIGRKTLAGESCRLVQVTLTPGFGNSERDWVIAWIGEETKRLHRVQMTLLGLESTAGADVDVVFSEWRTGPKNTTWAGRYVEHVQRPILTKAHEWQLDSLTVH